MPAQFQTLRRIGVAIALVPLVPGLSLLSVQVLDSAGVLSGNPPFEEERVFNALFCAFTVLGTLLAFRTLVLWTLGRATLTAVVTLVPLAQVVANRGIFATTGCVSDDILNVSQQQIGIGLWVWLSIWVWWGWERGGIDAAARWAGAAGRKMMSAHGRKLAATLGLFPFCFGVFWVIGVALDEYTSLSEEPVTTLAYSGAALAMLCAWIIIWRGAVAWDRRTTQWTAGLTAGLLLVPIALTALGGFLSSPWDKMLAVLPLIGWGVWIALLLARWPLRGRAPSADGGGPACMKCGYSLNGLFATRCPECGDEPTLDQLWRASFPDGV